jgi:hypothetical protein
MSMACPKSADGHAAGISLLRGKTKIDAAVESRRRRQAIKLSKSFKRDTPTPLFPLLFGFYHHRTRSNYFKRISMFECDLPYYVIMICNVMTKKCSL